MCTTSGKIQGASMGGLTGDWVGLAGLALVLGGCVGVPAGYGGYDEYGPSSYGGPVYGYGFHDTRRVGVVYDSSPGYYVVEKYPDHEEWNGHREDRHRRLREPDKRHREPWGRPQASARLAREPPSSSPADSDQSWLHTTRNRLSDEGLPSWRHRYERSEQARVGGADPHPEAHRNPDRPRHREGNRSADPSERRAVGGRSAVAQQDDRSDKRGEDRKVSAEANDRQGRAQAVRGAPRLQPADPRLLWSP